MPNYELAEAAETDLKNIAFYTIAEWGPRQAARYGAMLDAHFQAIGSGTARTKAFLRHRSDLRVSRVGRHYIWAREGKRPIVLAVFHESMDLMAHLRERL